MTEPRKCPAPGCGLDMVFIDRLSAMLPLPLGWHCPATSEQHELAALRARNAELEARNATPQRPATSQCREGEWVMGLFDEYVPWSYLYPRPIATDAEVNDCIERMELRLLGINPN